MPPSHLPRYRFPCPRAWLWAMVAVLLLKAAVPLLAIAAAQGRGAALVEVCSVYGVHTVQVDGPAEPAAPQTGNDSPCTLASLFGASALLPPVALTRLPGLLQATACPRLACDHPALRDAASRWLTAQVHAPPRIG